MIIIKTEKETVYLNESTYSSVTHNKEEGIIYVYHDNRGDTPIVWSGVKEVVYVNGSQQVRDEDKSERVLKLEERNDRLRQMSDELNVIAESNTKILDIENESRLSVMKEIEALKEDIIGETLPFTLRNCKMKEIFETFSTKIKAIDEDRKKRIKEQYQKDEQERERLRLERIADKCNKLNNAK